MPESTPRYNQPLLFCAITIFTFGLILIAFNVFGWPAPAKTTLSEEYYSEFSDFTPLTPDAYQSLIDSKKSFVIFVDQGGCPTADRLKGFMRDYAIEHSIQVYRMTFGNLKKSSLYEKVRFYPSVVIIDHGEVRGFLRADSDADAPAYNDHNAFKSWLSHYL